MNNQNITSQICSKLYLIKLIPVFLQSRPLCSENARLCLVEFTANHDWKYFPSMLYVMLIYFVQICWHNWMIVLQANTYESCIILCEKLWFRKTWCTWVIWIILKHLDPHSVSHCSCIFIISSSCILNQDIWGIYLFWEREKHFNESSTFLLGRSFFFLFS